jgi:hypothetical protein
MPTEILIRCCVCDLEAPREVRAEAMCQLPTMGPSGVIDIGWLWRQDGGRSGPPRWACPEHRVASGLVWPA